MKPDIKIFQTVAKHLSRTKGPLNFFALFLTDDSSDKWDLVICADWLEKKRKQGLEAVSKVLQSNLSKEQLLNLSRIIVLDYDTPQMRSLLKMSVAAGGAAEFVNCDLFGVQIRHAIILLTQTREAIRV